MRNWCAPVKSSFRDHSNNLALALCGARKHLLTSRLTGWNSDYLTLWTHYEGYGSDDKNRMISTASLLIGFAGVLLGASAR